MTPDPWASDEVHRHEKVLPNIRSLCVARCRRLSRVVFADELTNDDKYFLAGYEKMRAALVADDLVKANKAASELSAEGFEVPKSETLERARAAFANAVVGAVLPRLIWWHAPPLPR